MSKETIGEGVRSMEVTGFNRETALECLDSGIWTKKHMGNCINKYADALDEIERLREALTTISIAAGLVRLVTAR